MKRSFKSLSPPEVLALAISLEEEDSRILQEFARVLRPNYAKAARELDEMRGKKTAIGIGWSTSSAAGLAMRFR